jgi:hypothetical protein
MSHTYSTVKGDLRLSWSVETLWGLSKHLKTSCWEIPAGFLDSWSWGRTHLSQHIDRCLSADLSYPILVHEGKIVDGCHRVVKALAQGETHILAKVLTDLPDPDEEGLGIEGDPTQDVVWEYRDMVEVTRAFLEYQKRREYAFRHPIDGI